MPSKKPHEEAEQTPPLIPRRIREAIQQWFEHAPNRPSPGGNSKSWRKMGARFQLLRDTCNDDGGRRHELGSTRQWGTKLVYVKGDQDSVNELLHLWTESEVMSGYLKPDPEAPIEYTWLNDVLSYALQPVHCAILNGKSLQGGRYLGKEHTILLVSDYCIAAMDVCRDNAIEALKRERRTASSTHGIAKGGTPASSSAGGSRGKRLKPKPDILPQYGQVSKIAAAQALGCSTRTIERMPLTKIKGLHGNLYPVKEIRRILTERGVRQAPTK